MSLRGLAVVLLAPAAIVAAGAAFAPVASPRLAAVTARLSPDTIRGLANHGAELTLRLDLGSTGKQLGSYQVALTWDSTVVRLDSVRSADFAAPAVNYVSGREVRLTQATTTGAGGTVALARLYFRVVSSDSSRSTTIAPVFTEVTSTDFANLMADFVAHGTVVDVGAPRVTVSFSPDSVYERVGHQPRIDLTADLTPATGVSLGSYAATFTWDSTVMRLDSAAGAFGDFAMARPNAGEARVTAASVNGSSGMVTLARLYFSFLGTSFPKQTTLALIVTEMHAARSFADLQPTARNGKVVIGGVLRGDIDLSGTVSALDAQKILEAVVGLAPALPPTAQPSVHGDADCGGTLKALDAQIVLNQLVGNNVSAFCVAMIR